MLLYIFLLLAISFNANPDTNAECLAAFGRAEVYIEHAESHYAKIHNYLLAEEQNGAEDISEVDWEEKVHPQAEKVAMFTSLAMREIESVVPEDIKTDLWKKVWYDIYQNWKLGYDVFKKLDIYQSEYLLMLGGYENYVQMYRAIFYNKWDMIGKSKEKMLELKGQL